MKPVRYYKPSQLREMTASRKQEFSALFEKLKKKKPAKLDQFAHQLHKEAFEKFDCLSCANCCASISPIIKDKDAERLAKSQKMRTTKFIHQYLCLDEDQDYVFKQTPCPFLMADNYCSVYQDRPRACREYPHTDRSRFYQILPLTLKNCEVCPVVYAITDEIYRSAEYGISRTGHHGIREPETQDRKTWLSAAGDQLKANSSSLTTPYL